MLKFILRGGALYAPANLTSTTVDLQKREAATGGVIETVSHDLGEPLADLDAAFVWAIGEGGPLEGGRIGLFREPSDDLPDPDDPAIVAAAKAAQAQALIDAASQAEV